MEKLKNVKIINIITIVVLMITVCVSSLSCSTSGINFPAPNLEEAVREAINKPTGPILQSDLDGFTTLSYVYGVSSLAGLERCDNLNDLSIGNSELKDLSQLSDLTSLMYLTLESCEITDVSALSGLYQLEYLDLDYNQITDISPLAGLSGLTYLTITNNKIADISSLSNLYNLEYLHLYENQISDIGTLVANTGLSEGDDLTLQYNPLSDTSINTYIPQLEARGVDVGY